MTQMEQLTRAIAKAIDANPQTAATSVVDIDEVFFSFNDVEYVCTVKRVTP